MLKVFFNRSSFMVAFMNGLAGLEMLGLIWRAWVGKASLGPATYFLMLSWLGINLFNWIPWYPKNNDADGKPAKLGIRLHYHKCVVPTGYILTLAFGLKLLGASELAMIPFGILFLPIFYVAFILLYFHLRDRSSLTPGYFSHNFYLKDKDSSCTP